MFGKVLGAMLGLMVGLAAGSGMAGLVLGVLGVLLGHGVDRRHAAALDADPAGELPEPATRAEVDGEARATFARHLCTFFVAVARADGEVVRDEVRVVRAFFEEDLRFGPSELDRVRLALKQAIADPTPLEEAAAACQADLTPAARLLLINGLYELALADGSMTRSEREAIAAVSGLLGISPADQRSIAALHFGEGHRFYERLGLTLDASDEELKSAFRRLAALHHPDKVAHLGPGAVEAASRTFRELRDAYDALRRVRGI